MLMAYRHLRWIFVRGNEGSRFLRNAVICYGTSQKTIICILIAVINWDLHILRLFRLSFFNIHFNITLIPTRQLSFPSKFLDQYFVCFSYFPYVLFVSHMLCLFIKTIQVMLIQNGSRIQGLIRYKCSEVQIMKPLIVNFVLYLFINIRLHVLPSNNKLLIISSINATCFGP
jgi:hypothetical protein